MSQQKSNWVEEVFGWLKTVGLLREVKLRRVQRVRWPFTIAADVYNLVRMRTLVEAAIIADTVPPHVAWSTTDLHDGTPPPQG